ncbi:MAG: DMT family transporter [Candidatus Geothermincolales bacterium]
MLLFTLTAPGEGRLRLDGLIFALLAALSYAFLLIILKRLREKVHALTVALYQSLMNVLVLIPIAGFRPFPAGRTNWPCVLLLGLFHSGLVGLLYINAVKGVKAQHVGVISYLEPLSAYLIGWLALGERLGWNDLLGGLLIVAAGLLVILHQPHRVVGPPPKA